MFCFFLKGSNIHLILNLDLSGLLYSYLLGIFKIFITFYFYQILIQIQIIIRLEQV